MILAYIRHTDQWNRIASTEINLHIRCQLIFDKTAKSFIEAKIVSSADGAGNSELPHAND